MERKRPGTDGIAQCLVHKLPRCPHSRSPAVCAVSTQIPRVFAAVDDGIKWQICSLERLTRHGRNRRSVVGRTRHQRRTCVLPTHYQGTRLVPVDFIAVANPEHDLVDGDHDVHELFLANFFAQSKALAFGKTADEVRAEGTAEDIVPARVFSGNRPSTSIMAADLSPSTLG